MDHFYLKLLLHFILPRKNVYHYCCSLPILSTSLITAAITLLCHCSYYTAVSALLCRGLIITSTMDCYSSHCPTLPNIAIPAITTTAAITLFCHCYPNVCWDRPTVPRPVIHQNHRLPLLTMPNIVIFAIITASLSIAATTLPYHCYSYICWIALLC